MSFTASISFPTLIELARSRKRSDERALAFEIADMARVTARMSPNDRLVSHFDMNWWPKPSICRRAIPKCRAVSLLTPTSYSSGSIRAAYGELEVATGAHCSRSAMAAGRGSGEFRTCVLIFIRRTACRSGNEVVNDARQSLTARLFRRLRFTSLAAPLRGQGPFCSTRNGAMWTMLSSSMFVTIECSDCCKTKQQPRSGPNVLAAG
jgi:hypothetical protein